MIDIRRRSLLKGMFGLGAAGLAVGAGLLPMRLQAATADAADWPEQAFSSEGVDQAIEQLYGMQAEESDKITLNLPTIAQNGAVVPVTVESSLPGVTEIGMLVAKNPNALAASFKIQEGALPYVSNRLKMAESTDVVALVVSDGKLYRASKNVKVTVGGCGG